MFSKSKPSLSWRALPLRNEQISYNTKTAMVGPNHVWFTPEVIVFDAVDFLIDIIWLWETFKKLVPISIFRIAVISLLIFIVIGFKQDVSLSAAEVSTETATLTKSKPAIAISAKIKATNKQVVKWPVTKSYISTYFSNFHKGLDIPNAYGTKVTPFSAGTVVSTGWDGTGFGKLIQIKHRNGYLTKYAHLASINVGAGQKVSADTTIGSVGATGNATGSHLHFEVYKNGASINPLTVLP